MPCRSIGRSVDFESTYTGSSPVEATNFEEAHYCECVAGETLTRKTASHLRPIIVSDSDQTPAPFSIAMSYNGSMLLSESSHHGSSPCAAANLVSSRGTRKRTTVCSRCSAKDEQKEINMKFPYWYLLVIPTALYYLGSFLNVGVMALNHGQMPVLIPSDLASQMDFDLRHVVMTAQTHFKFFCDWINLGEGIASPGDILIWFGQATSNIGAAIWAALMLKDRN